MIVSFILYLYYSLLKLFIIFHEKRTFLKNGSPARFGPPADIFAWPRSEIFWRSATVPRSGRIGPWSPAPQNDQVRNKTEKIWKNLEFYILAFLAFFEISEIFENFLSGPDREI